MSNNFPGGNMKSTHIVFTVLFIAGSLMNGCKEEILPPRQQPTPDQTPPPTGAGVLSANIDGSSWVALDTDGIPAGTSTFSGNILHIRGARAVVGDTARENVTAETIDLILDLNASKINLGVGTYELGTIPGDQGAAQYHDAMSCVCNTDGTHSGTVTIKAIDLAKKAVSGTFAFSGVGVSGHGHIVSEGNFDVAWK
jgi:hypothetical protein